jgi:hypothetical protein
MGTEEMAKMVDERPYSKTRLNKIISLFIKETKYSMSRENLDGQYLKYKTYWSIRGDTKLISEIVWVGQQSELVALASYFQRYLKENGVKKTQRHYLKVREDFSKESHKPTREHLEWLLYYFNEGIEGALYPDSEVTR